MGPAGRVRCRAGGGLLADRPDYRSHLGKTHLGGLVALGGAAYDPRITKVAMAFSLISFVSDDPYREQRLGTIVPSFLRYVGDVGRLASLVAPRRLVIAGGAHGGGQESEERSEEDPDKTLGRAFYYTRRIYTLLKAEDELTVFLPPGPADIVDRLE